MLWIKQVLELKKQGKLNLLLLFLFLLLLGGLGTTNYKFTTSVEGRPNTMVEIVYADHFGGYGQGNGQFNSPFALTMNDSHIIVADYDTGRVQILDYSGNYTDDFVAGTRNSFIRGIAINNTHILVSVDDIGSQEGLEIFDLSGSYIIRRGSYGNGNGQFNVNSDLAMNDNHIFVADSQNHRVQIFDHDGTFVSSFGSFGSSTGRFNYP